jgi:hypothetical protein
MNETHSSLQLHGENKSHIHTKDRTSADNDKKLHNNVLESLKNFEKHACVILIMLLLHFTFFTVPRLFSVMNKRTHTQTLATPSIAHC